VVQLYIRDRVASVARPVRELKGFEKIYLGIGERRHIEFALTAQDLGFYNGQGQFVLEPGDFELYVGGWSNAHLSHVIHITADQVASLLQAQQV